MMQPASAKGSTAAEMLEPAHFFAGTNEAENWRRRRRKMRPTAKSCNQSLPKLQPSPGKAASIVRGDAGTVNRGAATVSRWSYHRRRAATDGELGAATTKQVVVGGVDSVATSRRVPMWEEAGGGFSTTTATAHGGAVTGDELCQGDEVAAGCRRRDDGQLRKGGRERRDERERAAENEEGRDKEQDLFARGSTVPDVARFE